MCAEQWVPLRGHGEQYSSNDVGRNSDTERTMQRGNFLAIINILATLDDILTGHLEKSGKWKIQNDIIECLSKFVRLKINDEIRGYYTIIADEVTDRFSNK